MTRCCTWDWLPEMISSPSASYLTWSFVVDVLIGQVAQGVEQATSELIFWSVTHGRSGPPTAVYYAHYRATLHT